MRRRRYLALLGVGAGAGLAGCSDGGNEPTPTDTGAGAATPTATATATETPEPDYLASFESAVRNAGLELRDLGQSEGTVSLSYTAGTRVESEVDQQVRTVADAYAEVVGQGWSHERLAAEFHAEGRQIGAFRIQQSWAASVASGELGTEEYYGRVMETLETLGVYTPGTTAPPERDFSGYGRDETDSFQLQPGFVGIEYTYLGSSNFTLRLESAGGDGASRSVVNRVGRVKNASTALRIPEGSYVLSVTTSGSWDLTVRQPRPRLEDATTLPTVVTNSKSRYVGPFAFDFGETTFEAQHQGAETFQVRLLDESGRSVETLFDQKGQLESSTTTDFTGIGWLDVDAEDSWTINLK